MPPRRVLIVGFGNPLMGDDGVGPALVERLRAGPLASWVRVVEGGTDATRILALWRGEETVILVDAFLGGGPPGSVYRLGLEQLLALPQEHGEAHALSLPSCLRWVLLAAPGLAKVDVEFLGVEPERVAVGVPLSAPVEAAVARLVRELQGRFANLCPWPGSALATLERSAVPHEP